MQKPNLFILGAPKCGTTALASWLSEHPQVFVSPVKEPHYFCTEFQLTKSSDTYQSYFKAAREEHKHICEASVWYLYSPVAVQNILAYNPDAKFIVMIRNPSEMVPSMHRHQIFNGDEHTNDLARALDLNDQRLSGEYLGMANDYPPDHLAYYHSCALGWQIERLLTHIPRNQLHIILHDDLKEDVQKMFKCVLNFLGIMDYAPQRFERINAAKVRKHPRLDKYVRVLGKLKSSTGIKSRFRVLSKLRNWNQRPASRELEDPQMSRNLKKKFEKDTKSLELILNRDLTHWRE